MRSMSKAVRGRLGLRQWGAPGPDGPARTVPGPLDAEAWLLAAEDRLAPFDQSYPAERAWLARHLAGDIVEGAVVELGPWLGASTLAIAAGLAARPGTPRAFHVYDRFRLEGQAHIFENHPDRFTYEEGTSFRGVFDERTASVAHLITAVHDGDVEGARWPTDEPIAFLFNDISKTWATWLAVRRTFYRALAVGSVVVEQDFAHPFTPWLHLSHYRWRSCFEVVGCIPGTSSVVFRLVRPIPVEELERDDPRVGFSPAEIQRAFDWSEGLVEEGRRGEVRSARVMLYLLHGDPAVAADELFKALAEGALTTAEAAELLPLLAERRAAQKRDETSGLWGSIGEYRRIRSRASSARKRNADWCAY